MFADVMSRWRWRAIRHCPGRFVFAGGSTRMPPSEISAPHLSTTEHIVAAAADPVLVTPFADGGLISYRKSDGTYLHTLNTREGFERKLHALGIAHAPLS